MAKAVVYTLLTAAFVVLIILPSSNQSGRNCRNITRRFGYKHPVPTFDPLIMKVERNMEEKGLRKSENQKDHKENKAFAEEAANVLEYFSNEGKLNISKRLTALFPVLDRDPKDGAVDFNEMESWVKQQAVDGRTYRTQKELLSRDKNGDGIISFQEYLPQFSDRDIAKNGMEHGEAGWWKEQFANADADQNGFLNFEEFKDFMHPEDSNNEKIQEWLLREKIKGMDHNRDGKLDFKEFLEHVYAGYKTYAEYESSGTRKLPTAEEKFVELDLNKDKFLTVEELKPIHQFLHSGELFQSKYYASYLIHEADGNEDGKLTLDEMLKNEDLFYNTVYDYINDHRNDDFHDEL